MILDKVIKQWDLYVQFLCTGVRVMTIDLLKKE